jgi:hypothetical protein
MIPPRKKKPADPPRKDSITAVEPYARIRIIVFLICMAVALVVLTARALF